MTITDAAPAINTAYADALREGIERAYAAQARLDARVLRTSLIMVERGERPTRDAHELLQVMGLLD